MERQEEEKRRYQGERYGGKLKQGDVKVKI